MSSEDSEDDIAAANEKMKQASMRFAINAANRAAPVTKKKKGPRAPSGSREEHKTTTRNVSKNIYKPCFNMPAKEPSQKKMMADKPAKPNAIAAAKAYGEA